MIKIKNISKKIGNFLLKDINIDINKGEYLIILGPNGSGKTLLLEILANFKKYDTGYIESPNKNIGFIYQDLFLFPHLNVYENIAYSLRIKKIKKDIIKEKINLISKNLNIKNLLTRDINTLSGGEKQKIALARALITEPEIFLLDEPTSSLDNKSKKEIYNILKKIHRETKATFIHVTHDFEEALYLADRVAIINNGELIQIGTPEEIFKKPNSKFVADFIGFENLYYGEINNHYFITDNDFKIYTELDNCPKIYATINPKEVIVSKEKLNSSACNNYYGKIINIRKNLNFIELTIDIGIILKSIITHHSLELFKFNINDNIWVSFKSNSVIFFI